MSDDKTVVQKNSSINGNCIQISNLTVQSIIPEMIRSFRRLIYLDNYEEIIIDCKEVDRVYPSIAVPIAGVIDFFRESTGVRVKIINPNKYLRSMNFNHPKQTSDAEIGKNTDTLHKIWKFSNSEEVNSLVVSLIKSIRRALVCEVGVLDGCTWALNEVMDNVIVHSGKDTGFIMAQINRNTNHLNVSIYDYGKGIYLTLKNSEFKPRTAVDAITLAIKEGVTRDKSIGLGNGLFGLYSLVAQNNGMLSIISGKGAMRSENHGEIVNTCSTIRTLDRKHQATSISFHFNLNTKVSIEEVFPGFAVDDMSIENMRGDFGDIVYKIQDIGTGTGTRESGEIIRNELINIYKKEKASIIIDFDEVGIVSSSFADELIGKLIEEIGFMQYQSIFRVINLNKKIQPIFDLALKKRLSN